MGCISTDTPESRTRELEEKLKRLTEFAEAFEELEWQILSSEGGWFETMPTKVRLDYQRVQALRSRAKSL